MQKIYTASWNLFTLTAEADRVFCQLVMFFTVFFHWMHKMKYSCYQQSSVIHGWFVYWTFGHEKCALFKVGNPISVDIVFAFHLAGCGFKSPSVDSGLTWYLSGAASKMVCLSNYCIQCMCLFFISNFMKWSAVCEASLCTLVLRSETMIWSSMRFDISLQSFKKHLVDIFSLQIERKNVPKSI